MKLRLVVTLGLLLLALSMLGWLLLSRLKSGPVPPPKLSTVGSLKVEAYSHDPTVQFGFPLIGNEPGTWGAAVGPVDGFKNWKSYKELRIETGRQVVVQQQVKPLILIGENTSLPRAYMFQDVAHRNKFAFAGLDDSFDPAISVLHLAERFRILPDQTVTFQDKANLDDNSDELGWRSYSVGFGSRGELVLLSQDGRSSGAFDAFIVGGSKVLTSQEFDSVAGIGRTYSDGHLAMAIILANGTVHVYSSVSMSFEPRNDLTKIGKAVAQKSQGATATLALANDFAVILTTSPHEQVHLIDRMGNLSTLETVDPRMSINGVLFGISTGLGGDPGEDLASLWKFFRASGRTAAANQVTMDLLYVFPLDENTLVILDWAFQRTLLVSQP